MCLRTNCIGQLLTQRFPKYTLVAVLGYVGNPVKYCSDRAIGWPIRRLLCRELRGSGCRLDIAEIGMRQKRQHRR